MADPVVTARISVCIPTFRRQAMLQQLLDDVAAQDRGDSELTVAVVVVDNDGGSARPVVDAFVREHPDMDVRFEVEPERNFAVVRNRAVNAADGDYIAFIDDDEKPGTHWLLTLLRALRAHNAAGVLGPVRPLFPKTPPRWLERSGLCERPPHPTGKVMHWQETRSGNALITASIFRRDRILFDPQYRMGGEDKDWFRRAIEAGHTFVWCEEGFVHEWVPESRMTLGYHLRRALVQGVISASYSGGRSVRGRILAVIKAATALAVYIPLLPLSIVAGSHVAVRILVKCCHHLGRLSAFAGVPLVRERSL